MDSRRLHAGHHLANKRAPARLIPEFWSHPGFDAAFIFFDTSAAIHLRSPFQSSPDASYDAFSSSLTTTVFSQRSMRRFGASPRRATPKGQTFISRTAPFPEAVQLPTPFHVQDTRPARSTSPPSDAVDPCPSSSLPDRRQTARNSYPYWTRSGYLDQLAVHAPAPTRSPATRPTPPAPTVPTCADAGSRPSSLRRRTRLRTGRRRAAGADGRSPATWSCTATATRSSV